MLVFTSVYICKYILLVAPGIFSFAENVFTDFLIFPNKHFPNMTIFQKHYILGTRKRGDKVFNFECLLLFLNVK